MRLLLLLLFALIVNISNSQTTKTVRKVVTLLPEQSIYLNSTSNGYFYGGKSRVKYKIDLPTNTVEWYYIYSTTPNEGDNQNLGLVSQLTRVVDPSGFTSVAVNSLTAPSGTGGLIDVYVMGREQVQAFEEKDAFGAWVYERPGGWPEGTSENARQGKKKIDDVRSGTVYLGLKNPHSKEGVNVTIEVAAIIEEVVVDMTEWSVEKKDQLFTTYRDNLQGVVSNDVADDVANCFVENLTTTYTPEDVFNKSESEQSELFKSVAAKCVETIQGGPKSENYERAVSYGKLGWSAYENGNLENAISFTLKAIEKDASIGWIKGNLALFYLIKGNLDSSIETYLDAIELIAQDRINAGKVFEELINDINNAKIKYPDLSGYEEILSLLEDEHEKFKIVGPRVYNLNVGTGISTSSTGTLKMKKIEIENGKTKIQFSFTSSKPSVWIAIDPKTHLVDNYTHKKLPLEEVRGITLVPEKTSISGSYETVFFELTFSALHENCTSFKFIETEGSGWNMNISIDK